MSSIFLLAQLAPAPWHIVGLVVAIVIALIPLAGAIAVYFKLGKREPHKPIGEMPLARELPSQGRLSGETREIISERVDAQA